MMIPEDAPVRLLNAQLEELEYGKLYEAYSSKGRKSAADPRVLFKVLVHGYLCGIYSSRKLEEACRYRIDFKWLLEDQKAPDHSTLARFRTGRCRGVVEDLFYQFVHKLESMGETDHKAVFIDGTKLESCAGRYTFVWRKTVEKQLAQVKEKLRSMTGLSDSEAVRRKLEKEAETIQFVEGKGKRKSQAQRDWEAQKGLLERWERYEEMRATLGEGRNSYSKTDPDAHVYAHERRPHEKRPAQAGIQCPDRREQRIYYRRGGVLRPHGCEDAAAHAGEADPVAPGAL